jgi:SlyX protein
MMSADDRLQERLAELEVKLTFIDETVQGLATADASQAVRIAALEHALRTLRGELSSMRNIQVDDARNEPPPPHY